MAKDAAGMAYGLPIVNGMVRCRVFEKFERFRPGLYGFTLPQIERELQRREPRFLPDNQEDAESLMVIPGITDQDEQFLRSRGVSTVGAVAFAEERQDRAGLLAFFQVDPREERRRRRLVRRFREQVADKGLDGALIQPEDSDDHLMALNDALVKIADDDTMTQEDFELLRDHLETTDLEALKGPLKAAFSRVAGSPGNRKPETLAGGLIKAVTPAE